MDTKCGRFNRFLECLSRKHCFVGREEALLLISINTMQLDGLFVEEMEICHLSIIKYHFLIAWNDVRNRIFR